MAVENKYVNSNIQGNVVNKLITALAAGTADLFLAAETFEVAAADDDGSIYRVFKSLNANLVPIWIGISCDAITGGTDWDLGLYRPDLGAVVIKDCLMDGQTLAVAAKLGPAAALSGLSNVDQANVGRRLFEHAGHTPKTKLEAYDMALTANTVGSAAGTVTIVGLFGQG